MKGFWCQREGEGGGECFSQTERMGGVNKDTARDSTIVKLSFLITHTSPTFFQSLGNNKIPMK